MGDCGRISAHCSKAGRPRSPRRPRRRPRTTLPLEGTRRERVGSSPAAAFRSRSRARCALLLGLAAAVLLSMGVFLAPRAVAWGWLVGFLVWSSAPIGAIVLTLIHETTGGRWGLASAPALRLGALCALPLPFFFALLFAGLKALYPWANGGASTVPDVAHFYFNIPAFAAVGFVALIGWAAIGAMLAIGAIGLLGASIALVFHGFAVSLTAVQWMLSIDPRYSDFGVRRGDRRATDHAGACPSPPSSRAARSKSRTATSANSCRDRARRLVPRPHDLHRQMVRRRSPSTRRVDRTRAWAMGRLIVGALLGLVVPIVGCAWSGSRQRRDDAGGRPRDDPRYFFARSLVRGSARPISRPPLRSLPSSQWPASPRPRALSRPPPVAASQNLETHGDRHERERHETRERRRCGRASSPRSWWGSSFSSSSRRSCSLFLRIARAEGDVVSRQPSFLRRGFRPFGWPCDPEIARQQADPQRSAGSIAPMGFSRFRSNGRCGSLPRAREGQRRTPRKAESRARKKMLGRARRPTEVGGNDGVVRLRVSSS